MRRLLLLLNNDSGTNYPDYPDNLIARYTTTNPDAEHTFNNGYFYAYEKNVEDLGDGTYRVEIYSDEDFSRFSCNRYTLTMDYLKVTKNVTSMFSMFHDCSSLTSLNVSNFDTSNVTDMNFMFSNCNSLTSLDVSNFDTSNVTGMSYMFNDCSLMTSLNVSNFDTSNVTDMGNMFYKCTNLKHVNLNNFNLDKCLVSSCSSMFNSCKSLLEIGMYNCSTDTISKIISSSAYLPTFTDGSVHKIYVDSAEVIERLTAPNGWEFVYFAPDLESLTINSQEDIYEGNEIQLTFNYYPEDCVVSKMDLEWSIIDGEKYAEIKEINYDGCVISALEPGMFKVQLEDKNTGVYSKVELEVLKATLLLKAIYTTTNPDGDHTFNNGGSYSYEKNVEDLGDGTYRVEIYSYKDFSSFRCNTNTLTMDYLKVTKNVTSMNSMFENCNSLTSLDVSNFDTSNVTSMSYMFNGCISLTRIYALNYKDIDSINKVLAKLPSNNGSMVLVDGEIDGIKINSEMWTVLSIEHARAFDSECFSLIPRSTITIERSPLDVAEYIYDKKFFVKEGNKFQLISEGLSEIICKLNSGSEEIFKISTAYIEDKNLYYPACDIKLISDTIEPVIGNNFTVDATLMPSNANEEITYTPDLTSRYITKRNKNTFIVWGRINPFNIECEGKYVSSTVNVAIDYYQQAYLVIVYTANVNNYYPKATDKASDWWETTTYNGPGDYTAIITASTMPTTLKFDVHYQNMIIKSIDYIRTDNITDMSYMFEECNNLTSIGNLSDANTSNVTNMFAMFRGCSVLPWLDLSWNTYNVTDMGSMFENCSNLNELYTSSWDTSNVYNMQYMFSNCSNLYSLDLSNWYTYNVNDMSYMFNSCSSLSELYLNNFDMSNIWYTDYMFSGCYNLTYLHLDYCSYDTVDKIINSTDFPVDNYGTIYCSSDVYNSGLTPPGNWTFEVV